MPLSDTTADTDPTSLACAVIITRYSVVVDALVGHGPFAWVGHSLVDHIKL
ncbi:hypothetical protein COCC4DRAFT_130397 [Bipolaris maydis ATCC 48331]|uniref:Uncharacterized protein n=1 Tax=Cochliobolus heterostrophus (strain C4 / ATCC 48331 / race T) TaxID=665024 RepID=N4XH67_COCH4|nr:uncharacterized protein COCC4DRAFT_130397 [Bipolaris maydis ATCC 48331]ENI07908.1 hypothetical protein COCC4DRAFT_130397 [Bipolaris maydis ATCC 48331]